MRGRREAFVDADVAEPGPLLRQNHLVLPDELERFAHHGFVIESPLLHRCARRIRELLGGQRHAIAFPRVGLVVVDLPLDLVDVRRARVE